MLWIIRTYIYICNVNKNKDSNIILKYKQSSIFIDVNTIKKSTKIKHDGT